MKRLTVGLTWIDVQEHRRQWFHLDVNQRQSERQSERQSSFHFQLINTSY